MHSVTRVVKCFNFNCSQSFYSLIVVFASIASTAAESGMNLQMLQKKRKSYWFTPKKTQILPNSLRKTDILVSFAFPLVGF